MLRVVASFACCLVAVGSSLLAQERRALLGTVVDADGKSLPDATVQCAHVPAGREGEVAVDRVAVTADERGRFRASVLPCTKYRVWAIGPAREDGGRSTSGVVWGAAGQLLELVAKADCARALQIGGLEPWAERGPFRVRLLPACVELPELVADVADDAVTLPPLPASPVQVELLDREGRVLHRGRFAADAKAPPQTLNVPPPQSIPIEVVDGRGAPVAGAEVLLRCQGQAELDGAMPTPPARATWTTLGRTDEHGRFTATVASDVDPFESRDWFTLLFLVRKDGHASTSCGFAGSEPFGDWQARKPDDTRVLRCTLQPSKALRGRIVAGDRPLAGAIVTVRFQLHVVNAAGNGHSHENLVRGATSDANGRFVIDDVPQPNRGVTIALDVGGDDPLRSDAGSTPPRPVLLHRLATMPEGEHVIDIAACRPLRLRTLTREGAPAIGADVLFLGGGGGDPIDGFTATGATDAAGRLHVLVARGRWFVFVRDATGMASCEVGESTPEDVSLQLQPLPAMHGRFVDAAGQPVAGAQLRLKGMSFSGARRKGPLDHIADALNLRWLLGTVTAGDGTFACRLIAQPSVGYEVYFHHARGSSEPFRVTTGGEPVTVGVR